MTRTAKIQVHVIQVHGVSPVNVPLDEYEYIEKAEILTEGFGLHQNTYVRILTINDPDDGVWQWRNQTGAPFREITEEEKALLRQDFERPVFDTRSEAVSCQKHFRENAYCGRTPTTYYEDLNEWRCDNHVPGNTPPASVAASPVDSEARTEDEPLEAVLGRLGVDRNTLDLALGTVMAEHNLSASMRVSLRRALRDMRVPVPAQRPVVIDETIEWGPWRPFMSRNREMCVMSEDCDARAAWRRYQIGANLTQQACQWHYELQDGTKVWHFGSVRHYHTIAPLSTFQTLPEGLNTDESFKLVVESGIVYMIQGDLWWSLVNNVWTRL